MRLSCSTHSATRFWWVMILRLFMIRTRAASIANLLSLLTSSMIFFFSSDGGSCICKTHYCQVSRTSNRSKDSDTVWTTNSTFILRILSVNLRLNSKTSFGEIVLPFGSLLRILYFPHDSEWRTRTVSSSERFSCVTISEKLSLSASLNSNSSAPWQCGDWQVGVMAQGKLWTNLFCYFKHTW